MRRRRWWWHDASASRARCLSSLPTRRACWRVGSAAGYARRQATTLRLGYFCLRFDRLVDIKGVLRFNHVCDLALLAGVRALKAKL